MREIWFKLLEFWFTQKMKFQMIWILFKTYEIDCNSAEQLGEGNASPSSLPIGTSWETTIRFGKIWPQKREKDLFLLVFTTKIIKNTSNIFSKSAVEKFVGYTFPMWFAPLHPCTKFVEFFKIYFKTFQDFFRKFLRFRLPRTFPDSK